jgi:DNA-binding NarL/FixJ family response regulator
MTQPEPIALTAGAPRKRILIVDDHPLVREGVRGTINREPDLTVCGEAANAMQAVDLFQKLAPDVVLVDITLPGKSGLELVKDLKAAHPGALILALSMHDESHYAERILRAGASGYITKEQPPEELIKALRRVLDNGVYVSREMSENLLKRLSRKPRANLSPMEILTDRELETFRLIARGKSTKEIAGQLHIAAKTVAVHSANIRQKLNLQNTAQLIRFAAQSEDAQTLSND